MKKEGYAGVTTELKEAWIITHKILPFYGLAKHATIKSYCRFIFWLIYVSSPLG